MEVRKPATKRKERMKEHSLACVSYPIRLLLAIVVWHAAIPRPPDLEQNDGGMMIHFVMDDGFCMAFSI